MNAVKTFIDTNILIYAFTADEPLKQAIALDFLDKSLPVVSTQVLKEFSNVMLKRANVRIKTVQDTIKEILSVSELVNEGIQLIIAAFGIYERYKFSFYDSLIIATALNSKCITVLSEDLQDRQIIDGKLKIVNPFRNM